MSGSIVKRERSLRTVGIGYYPARPIMGISRPSVPRSSRTRLMTNNSFHTPGKTSLPGRYTWFEAVMFNTDVPVYGLRIPGNPFPL